MESEISFAAINAFNVQWRWVIENFDEAEQPLFSHIHDVCEIYVNVSGNVSFMVENHVYPVSRGDIVITGPNEYHHCIYHTKCTHEHFWILIPIYGNEHLLSCFLNREHGTGNLISLPDENREKFLSLCYYMNKCKKLNNMKLEQYAVMMQILSILNHGYNEGSVSLDSSLPQELTTVLNYINQNFKTIKTIKEVTKELYISQSTLSRLFRNYLGIRPYDYIVDKRITHAKTLLLNGKTVSNACYESGFPDCSHFVAKFKKKFGITPLQYKKHNQTGL